MTRAQVQTHLDLLTGRTRGPRYVSRPKGKKR